MNLETQSLFAALDQHKKEKEKWDQHREKSEREHQLSEAHRSELVSHCRSATAQDYAEWLLGFLRRGGQITHVYDYPLSQRGKVVVDSQGSDGGHPLQFREAPPSWLVLTSYPPSIPALHGARSVKIIIPKRIKLDPREVGHGHSHNSFFFMKGFQVIGYWIPLYSDVREVLSGMMKL